MSTRIDERFSGHESFVCRYGWLPKVFRAVRADSGLLRDDARATHTLGIGRNMVKSIQFWGEATGVIRSNREGGHLPGPVGELLFGEEGWDLHLESLESMWLLHWWLVSEANLASWREVFSEGHLQPHRDTDVMRFGAFVPSVTARIQPADPVGSISQQAVATQDAATLRHRLHDRPWPVKVIPVHAEAGPCSSPSPASSKELLHDGLDVGFGHTRLPSIASTAALASRSARSIRRCAPRL